MCLPRVLVLIICYLAQVEALRHAQKCDMPVVVAVNKCDLKGADPQRVTQQLMSLDPPIVPESAGGDVMFAHISAKEGTGIEELEEMIALQAELMELRADPAMRAQGVVFEARVDRSVGVVVNVLVKARPTRVLVCSARTL